MATRQAGFLPILPNCLAASRPVDADRDERPTAFSALSDVRRRRKARRRRGVRPVCFVEEADIPTAGAVGALAAATGHSQVGA
jgi:hypothetical protein